MASGIDRVFSITQPDKRGRVGFSVQFKTVANCEQTLSLLTSREFKIKRPHITTAQDESELTRVGGSRMRAIADYLRSEFDGIHIGRDFVRLGKEKLLAADFASNEVRLGTRVINVEAEVARNGEAQVNPALRTVVGGREVNGVRLSRKRRLSGGSEGDSPATGQRDRRHKKNGRGDGRQVEAPRVTNALPALDGRSTGGVTYFHRGHTSHGGGHVRDNVMRVSGHGQPAYLFQ
jgi:hypothetical protein